MNISLNDQNIAIDKFGRYRLNDLHKAALNAGLDVAHKNPGDFMRTQMAQAFVDVIEKSGTLGHAPVEAIPRGKNAGTFASRSVLFAYAAWLNTSLYAKLIQSLEDFSLIQEALNNFEVPDDIPDMYVYAIKNTSTGNIKLGISKNPEQRLKQLQTGCDGKLELVAYRKAVNGFKDEQLLHIENKQYNIHGEWFVEQSMDGFGK